MKRRQFLQSSSTYLAGAGIASHVTLGRIIF